MAAAGLAMPVAGALGSRLSGGQSGNRPIAFFTKPLDGFEPEFMAETLAMAGINGFDLAVRPGGRVEPEKIDDELPKVIETGKKYGLSCDMMVSSIREANRETKNVLKTASSCGVKHYRLGYFNYDFKAGIPASLEKIREDLQPLADLNRQYHIQAGYQNHTGTRVGAPMWDVWELIRDFPVSQLSSQFDIQHAVTEGAASWPLALRLLSKNIGSLAVKDFTWEIRDRKPRIIPVPMGEGIVDFDLFFSLLRELEISVPVSLHVEYPFLGKDEENLSLLEKQKIIVGKLKHDVDFIRGYLNKF
jgi:sugar phosphate isomerase/epimerase